ncbi:protein disulfide oxidoreductase [Grimontia marina]|uniref:Thiol-disulfide oxidoreductase ResA n=1 Tax=Grimontia marina TaxID=646534 RepID=A0A128ER84_9GAMM|nr:protein disulfide oxidoreductase [Grimontia marina]CZF77073.1 Thiol-disulfide oxidoreductase ResA [Grimontia marina]
MDTPKDKSKWKQPGFWIKEILTLVILFSVISFALDLWRSQDMPNEQLPNVALQDLSGETIDLVALSEDKPVVLYFWATWCGACKFVTPTVDWLAEDHDVISVAITSGSNDRITAYLQHHDLKFATINDERGSLSGMWGVRATPTIVIVKDGKIASITTGITTPPGLLARLWLA